jgi:hypothetical protein
VSRSKSFAWPHMTSTAPMAPPRLSLLLREPLQVPVQVNRADLDPAARLQRRGQHRDDDRAANRPGRAAAAGHGQGHGAARDDQVSQRGADVGGKVAHPEQQLDDPVQRQLAALRWGERAPYRSAGGRLVGERDDAARRWGCAEKLQRERLAVAIASRSPAD